ncbi:MAG TPA: phage holin family protein [Methylotenera sp.]|nr:phage holin family protein [Methylotenera sp.]
MAADPNMADEGLLASIKNLTATLIDIVYTRLDLLCTDMEEERQRLVSLLAMAFISLFCLCVGVVLLAILVVVIFWDTYRLLALGLITGFFLISGAMLWALAMHALKSMPRMFAASLAELSKDRAHIEAQDTQG